MKKKVQKMEINAIYYCSFPQFFTHCAIFNFSAQDVTYITCQAGIRSCKLIAKSLISQKKGGKYES